VFQKALNLNIVFDHQHLHTPMLVQSCTLRRAQPE
jgi:hypothetical protein